MTLSEMRQALERGSAEEPSDSAANGGDNDASDGADGDNARPKARLPPDERGLKESRSSIVTLEGRKGSLTFSNSVGALKRAGSSREGTAGLRKPPRRGVPQRSQSTAV